MEKLKVIELNNEDKKQLIKTIKKYSNMFKALMQLDPAIASEFRKKQDFYFSEAAKTKGHVHDKTNSGCCSHKIDNKSNIYIN